MRNAAAWQCLKAAARIAPQCHVLCHSQPCASGSIHTCKSHHVLFCMHTCTAVPQLRRRARAGLCCILANCAQFAFVTIFPIFVTPDYPPFGSTLVQFFSSGFLVFIGSPYGNTYFLPTAKRANPMLPKLQPVRHLLLMSITRTLRFEDVFTDASISYLFFSISRSGECPWLGGRSRCDKYMAMAIANIVCAGLDFFIALIFVIAGFVLENVSKRGHRCTLPPSCLRALNLLTVLHT
jgi:hypothetical protein